MDNNIITIKQLPVIVSEFESLRAGIEAKVQNALALDCTQDTVKKIKALRADLNKDFKELDERRKDVKNKILAPYLAFENAYNECVGNVYQKADSELRARINSVESEIKKDKENEIRKYFDVYTMTNGIDFLTFEQIGLNITLSASIKALKQQCKAFVDNVINDISMIEDMDCYVEIMAEYKQSLDMVKAISTVEARHKAIEREKALRYDRKAIDNQPEVHTTEILSAPTVIDERLYKTSFTVRATKEKLKALKQFVINNNIEIIGG